MSLNIVDVLVVTDNIWNVLVWCVISVAICQFPPQAIAFWWNQTLFFFSLEVAEARQFEKKKLRLIDGMYRIWFYLVHAIILRHNSNKIYCNMEFL